MTRLTKFISIALAAAIAAGGVWLYMSRSAGKFGAPGSIDESKPHDYFTCPMHPDVHQHEPGRCPLCNMTLVKISAGEPVERKVLYYRHPMNPAITSPTPAQDEMGMPFTPVYEVTEPSTVKGRGMVTIPTEKLQLIGVRFGKVERASLEKIIRAYGRVAYDPDLYQVQEEYLSAVDLVELSSEAPPASRERSWRLLKAAETRLKLLGLNDAQIQRLRERRQVDPQLLLGAQESGKVWVYAEVYESDLSFVRVGQTVSIDVKAYPGKMFSGKILAIDPVINPKTRTVKIRSEIDDPAGELKPDLYVNVRVHSDLGEALTAPENAILNSGSEQHAFVHRGDGRFEPRRVRIGRKAEGKIEILEGLSENEEVVVSGNFLIDSESRLRAGMSGMSFYGGKEAAE